MPRNPKSDLAQSQFNPRPTRLAFQPTTKQDICISVLIGAVCLIGFGMGLYYNRTADFFSFAESAERSANLSGSSMPIWLQPVIYYGFPIFLPIAGYFFFIAWSGYRKTRAFKQGCKRGSAAITHLWIEPPSGSGKKYFVGYTFKDERTGSSQSVYQQVDVWTFKRLSLEENLPVEYLPEQPSLSRLELPQSRPRSRKQPT